MKHNFQIGNVVMYGGKVTRLTGDDIVAILKGGEQPDPVLLDAHLLSKTGFTRGITPIMANSAVNKWDRQFKANALRLVYSPTYGYRESKYDTQFKAIHELQNFVQAVFGEPLIKD